MVPGVASLRCPACSRPFLTLPQQEEARVNCPHCGHSASAGTYAAAGGAAAGADLVRSLRERAGLAAPEPPAPQPQRSAWPEAPPLFSPPPILQPPAREERPLSWPPASADPAPLAPETSRFRLSDLKNPPTSARRPWESAAAPERERNLPLGLLILALALFGSWLLWLSLQPPLAAEFPVPEVTTDQMELEEPDGQAAAALEVEPVR